MDFHEDNKSVTKTIDSVAEIVVKYMSERVLSMSTAESCTGGALSEAITSVPGASNMFLGGAVTYSEELKRKLLGVKQETLEKYTVYSRETALEMSRGVRELTGADVGVGITGIAGPGGGTEDKPVGTVFVAVSCEGGETVKDLALYNEVFYEKLDRRSIRELTVLRSLQMVYGLLTKKNDTERNGA